MGQRCSDLRRASFRASFSRLAALTDRVSGMAVTFHMTGSLCWTGELPRILERWPGMRTAQNGDSKRLEGVMLGCLRFYPFGWSLLTHFLSEHRWHCDSWFPSWHSFCQLLLYHSTGLTSFRAEVPSISTGSSLSPPCHGYYRKTLKN